MAKDPKNNLFRLIRTSTLIGLLLTATIVNCQPSGNTQEVIYLAELISQGIASPISPSATFPWTSEYSPQELTEVGKRQMYNLGKQVASQYPTIFDNLDFGERNITAFSLNNKRSQISATSHLSGLVNMFNDEDLGFENNDPLTYPPQEMLIDTTKLTFKTPLPNGLKPIPVFSKHEENLSDIWNHNEACLKNKLVRDSTKSKLEKWLNKNERFLDQLKKCEEILEKNGVKIPMEKNGKQIELIERSYLIADSLLSDYYNAEMPILDENSEIFRFCKIANSLHSFVFYPDEATTLLSLAPFYRMILKQLEKRINPKLLKPGKNIDVFDLFSVNQAVLLAHLDLLGKTSLKCTKKKLESATLLDNNDNCWEAPHVASNLIFELSKRKEDKERYFVRMIYNGTPVDFCESGDANSGYECEFKEFKRAVEGTFKGIEEDDKCQVEKSFSKKWLTMRTLKQTGLFVMTFITFVLISTIIKTHSDIKYLQNLKRKLEKVD